MNFRAQSSGAESVTFLGFQRLVVSEDSPEHRLFTRTRKLLPGHPDPRLNLSLTLESAGRFDQARDHARTALQIHPGHIASLQQLARLKLLHPPAPLRAPPHSPHSPRDPEAKAELRGNLEEIALRGESAEWKDWARLQLVRLEGGR